MIESISFKTRARTIDHLGREQIADCPTAISELWKNAYDAYAREVALHIYQENLPICALLDNGHGLNKEEFINKWLVIGTESKALQDETPVEDRQGLDPRPRQGQKGIGRLSAAALGSLLLFISKRKDDPFVVALIDWRIFENPYLLLDDVQIPLIEVESKSEILTVLPQLFEQLLGNIQGSARDLERDRRVALAWEMYDKFETNNNRTNTSKLILDAITETNFSTEHLLQWDVWKESRKSGTALLVADISFDLRAQLNRGTGSALEQAELQAKERLRETLSNFTDPFPNTDDVIDGYSVTDFAYTVTAWHGQLPTPILSTNRSFDYKNLEELEHVIEGEFDESGVFKGRVKAFGVVSPERVVIPPKSIGAVRSDTRVGPFRLRIGTFEQMFDNSSHPKEVWDKLNIQARMHGGFMVYRDGLRVMPYGREDNDFFEIEKRRSNHAGREFWSYRRIFGRVAIARATNPNLKDKAGREGIIDNKAAKVFRDLVENLLMVSARRYFGTDSSYRKELLPDIKLAKNELKIEAAQKTLRARQRKKFRENLKKFLPLITKISDELNSLADEARDNNLPSSEDQLVMVRERLLSLQTSKSELTFGTIPKNLGENSDDYKHFRKLFISSTELISQLNSAMLSQLELLKPKSATEIAYSELSRHASSISVRLKRWSTEAKNLISTESDRLSTAVSDRYKTYHSLTLPIIEELENGSISLSDCLNNLESKRLLVDQENEDFFEAYLSTLRNLSSDLDIEALLSFTMERHEESANEILRLNSLAQLGITVEIIGHEIDGLEYQISNALSESPSTYKTTPQYKAILSAHSALAERLRFLSPLKLSGQKSREWITGAQIFDYTFNFLRKSITNYQVNFHATPEFLSFSVYEQAQRIMPTFVNLVNNSIYWSHEKNGNQAEVILDVCEGKIMIADNGPGVDPEDIPRLFTLFFTTKIRGGRGVGLYLSRENLATGGHTIAYSVDPTINKLPGANFLINFKGAKYV